MSRKCLVCTHPEYQKIDEALIRGESLRDIARHYELDKSAILRHKQNHLPVHLIKANEKDERQRACSLVEEIHRLKKKAERIAEQAEQKGDFRTALSGIRELTRIVEILARMQGEIQNQNINIVLNTKWIELRTIILNALDEFPEAKIKVAEAIKNDIQ